MRRLVASLPLIALCASVSTWAGPTNDVPESSGTEQNEVLYDTPADNEGRELPHFRVTQPTGPIGIDSIADGPSQHLPFPPAKNLMMDPFIPTPVITFDPLPSRFVDTIDPGLPVTADLLYYDEWESEEELDTTRRFLDRYPYFVSVALIGLGLCVAAVTFWGDLRRFNRRRRHR